MNSILKKIFVAVAMGAALAGNAVPPEAGPVSAPATGDEGIVQKICDSKAPLLVLDHFHREKPVLGEQALDAVIDIDGDLAPDIGHGDIVKKIATFSGKDIVTYGISESHRLMTADMIADRFFDIAAKIENGEMEKPSAIIFSISFAFPFKSVNTLLAADFGLTPDNVLGKREEILRMLEEKNAQNPHELVRMAYRLYEGIAKLKSLGVPVITGSGNDFSETTVNLAALLGAVPVGALTHDGKAVHPVSNVNSLTSVYRLGEVFSRVTQDGGIDINDDGAADFPADMLSNNREMLDTFYETGIYDNKTRFPTTFGTSLSAPGICNR